MKINTEQITPLNQGTANVSQKTDSSGSFESILAGQVEAQSSGQNSVQSPVPGQSIAELTTLIKTGSADPSNASSQTERTVMDNMDNILNEWENYADQLGSSNKGDLRQAYSTLTNIESGVQQLKSDVSSLGSGADKLSPLVNELEVMTMTEKIKFNRGDYIS